MSKFCKYNKLSKDRLESLLNTHQKTIVSLKHNIQYYGATNSNPQYNGVAQLKIVEACVKDIQAALRQKTLL